MPLSKVVSNSLSLTTLAASGATTLSSTLGVTGVTTVQAGTAALPAITTTGDTNTGIFFPAADTIAFSEGGVEAMRIDSSGTLILNQGQIQFPATQVASANANTLDDYEEGTFTATVTGSSGSPTVFSNVCSYVKIGRMVSITMNFGITKNTAAGAFSIGSLPFVVESGYYPQGVMLTDFCSSTYSNPIIQFNSAGTVCYPLVNNGGTAAHDQANWSAWSGSSFTLRISATYRTS